LYAPLPTVGGEGIVYPMRPHVRPSVLSIAKHLLLRDAISLYLMDGFQ